MFCVLLKTHSAIQDISNLGWDPGRVGTVVHHFPWLDYFYGTPSPLTNNVQWEFPVLLYLIRLSNVSLNLRCLGSMIKNQKHSVFLFYFILYLLLLLMLFIEPILQLIQIHGFFCNFSMLHLKYWKSCSALLVMKSCDSAAALFLGAAS